MDGESSYVKRTSREVGEAWNRFWFTPSDAFPLSVLRILVGLASLAYLASHTADLVRWFGPHGLLPINTVNRLTGAVAGGATAQQMVFRPSYFYLTDEPAMLWLLHGLGALVLLAFTAGVWTRVTNILSFFVVLAYVHRAPMITAHIEPVLTMLLIYLCLGPAGRYLSVDRCLGWVKTGLPPGQPGEPVPSWTATISLRLIQLHLAGFYLLMGLSKLGGEVWWNGMAVWWLAARTEARLVDFTPLHEWAYLFNAWTHGIVLFELLYGVLVWNRLARPLLMAASVVVWVSIAMLTGLVGFCALMLVANAAFLPAYELRACCASCCGRFGLSTDSATPSATGKNSAAA